MFKIISRIFFFFSHLGVRGWLFLPTVYCLLPTNYCTAQDKSAIIKYAREIIDTLAAPGMHGRGYVNRGDSIAADYIKKEFEKIGVKPTGKELEQRFSFPVNTFNGYTNIFLGYKEETQIKEKLLIPGKDFLIRSDSPPSDMHCRLVFFDEDSVKSQNKYDKFHEKTYCSTAVINAYKIKDKNKLRKIENNCINKTKYKMIVIFQNEKLTWDVSQKQSKKPIIEILYNDSLKIENIDAIVSGISTQFIPNYQSQNVLGHIKGTQYPDSFIVFSAHYDHLGRMGKEVYFPGANDNASGCAMLLTLAKYYSEHPPKYSIAFMAFGAEEAGLIGSKYYVEHPLFPLKQIKFLVNMDIMGTGDEGIKVVNATEHKKEFDELVKINAEKSLLPVVSPRGKSANSDHYFFSEAGVKTFFIYTLGGIKAYHDIYDRPETLPLTKFEEVFKLLTSFTDYLQKTE